MRIVRLREYTIINSVAVGSYTFLDAPSPALVGVGIDLEQCDPARLADARNLLWLRVHDDAGEALFEGLASALPHEKDLFVDVAPAALNGSKVFVHSNACSVPMLRLRLKWAVRP